MVKIFVGNLSSSTTVEELRELFGKYGEISECDVVKNYGFVHMDKMSEAEEAIRNLHRHELNGWCMNVEMSKGRPKSTTKLHVGNLGDGVTGEVLRAKFAEFGTVVECDIVKDYAFVHMERMEDAMEAINNLDNTAFKGKLMNVQLSTSRLRTAPGMGDHTGCYVCGKHGHWSKDCALERKNGYGEGTRGHSGRGGPRGPPDYGRGSYGMEAPPASDYMSAPYSRANYLGGMPPPLRRLSGYGTDDRYAGRAIGSYADKSSPYECYDKYMARPSYGGSYFEDRRVTYPPPPPPPSSLPKPTSSIDPYDPRPLPPPSSAVAAYYARDRSPIGRAPVTSDGYNFERKRLSPVSSRSSYYATPRPKDQYAQRYAPY
ncbi:RNA-binding protein 4.1-like [Genypterus blacodes]|uniref:RNA-binding protein 4.1-like n=1 Tax=Genypterus blacodes TaxID=154954 RepID=UPI003F7703CD